MAIPDAQVAGFSWLETVGRAGKVVGAALPPVAVLVGATARFPIETTWLLQHWQAWACMGTAFGAVLVATGIGNRDLIQGSRRKDLIIDATAAALFAGTATFAFLKVMEASMTGNYGMLLATEATAVGVGAMAAYTLWKRVGYRADEKVVILEAERVRVEREAQDVKIKIKAQRGIDGRARRIEARIYQEIYRVGGAVSDKMAEQISQQSKRIAGSGIGREDVTAQIKVTVEATLQRARQIRPDLVTDDAINNDVAEEFVRPARH